MIWNENVKYWNQVLDAHTVWARDHTKDYLEEMESHKLNPSALTYGTLARKPTIRKKIESWGVWGVTGYHVNPCDLMLGCGASMGRCFQKATCRGISQEVSRRFAISNFGSATWGLSLCGLRWCPKCPKVVWQGIASVAGIACIALCLLSCWHLLLSQEGLHQSELRFCISIHSEYIPQPIRSNQIQSDPIRSNQRVRPSLEEAKAILFCWPSFWRHMSRHCAAHLVPFLCLFCLFSRFGKFLYVCSASTAGICRMP